ncbi:hypothetical protein KQ51_00460 [Candidatus Izimaplasma bacterium HR1]|jgi:hypothetical protein|uniref:hypothetical protein n=1 Tax=Candidatus Izimoplasma sp. HR1 TaxID=1541959 RepID=UPI0004F92441|nr:hypothetical protein KQ51_00460 [Candidatus Izimaplasma bacterium HR1]
MDNNPKKDEDIEEEITKEEQENLDELKEVIKKLEEMSKNQPPQKSRRKVISFEFGGFFHHNRVINFIFTYILTFIIAFFISELFNFVSYRDIIYFAVAILLFSIAEELIKTYVMMRYFRIILRTFGTIFYFIYLLIFFVVDQYILVESFNFINEIALPFFVLFLALTRYVLGQIIRNFLRYQTMR